MIHNHLFLLRLKIREYRVVEAQWSFQIPNVPGTKELKLVSDSWDQLLKRVLSFIRSLYIEHL